MRSSAVRERKRNRLSVLLLVGLIVIGLAAGVLSFFTEGESKEASSSMVTSGDSELSVDGAAQIDSMSVIEDRSVYDADDPDSIVHFYVTVRYGSAARGTNHTFAEVNNVVRFADGAHADVEVYAEALVQVGDENGPAEGMLGYGETKSNAMIRVRGNTSTAAKVKSYKLSLDDDAGSWRGQTNIALNKHAYDPTRLRNKLYFDILKEIPEIPSVRTQFVVLHVKDETAGATEFENYGLFTQAEVPTKRYLKNHGMDGSGYLYKVISFNWEKNSLIKNIDDPEYDAAAMDSVISNRGREDNQKLIDLIDMVNDTSVDINYIIDTYFDRENYVSWLAYNILMGNIDTMMQNYYLYSPLNGNKWYFIPWDGDASLKTGEWYIVNGENNYAQWQSGISNYWGIILHQRFLKYASNREELAEKVEELHSWLNEEYISKKAAEYNRIVENYVYSAPDILHLGATPEIRQEIIDSLSTEIENNYNKFIDSLSSLMPFWIYEPVKENGQIIFRWEDAYDFAAKNITYHLQVSEYPDMRDTIIDAKGLDVLNYTASDTLFGKGSYFVKIVAYSTDGRTVEACNMVQIEDEKYFGVMEFIAE